MKCPYCDNKYTRVIDSRETESGLVVRRRRKCERCQERFSTKEKIEILKLVVVKRDGQREGFDKNKIINSLKIATNKRVKAGDLKELIEEVEAEIFARSKGVIETRKIGQIILKRLKVVDEVSYLRYASVFKSFASSSRFSKEAEKIK